MAQEQGMLRMVTVELTAIFLTAVAHLRISVYVVVRSRSREIIWPMVFSKSRMCRLDELKISEIRGLKPD